MIEKLKNRNLILQVFVVGVPLASLVMMVQGAVDGSWMFGVGMTALFASVVGSVGFLVSPPSAEV